MFIPEPTKTTRSNALERELEKDTVPIKLSEKNQTMTEKEKRAMIVRLVKEQLQNHDEWQKHARLAQNHSKLAWEFQEEAARKLSLISELNMSL